MYTLAFKNVPAVLIGTLVAFGALCMYTTAFAATENSHRDFVRSYTSDDGRSHTRIETHTSTGSEIRNFVSSYSSSNNHSSNSDDETYSTQLRGSEEVPSVQTTTTGDAFFEYDADDDTLEYEVNVYDGEDITAGHLHCAPDGQNGPVAVTLFHSNNGVDIDGTLSEGSIANSDVTSNCAGIDDVADLVKEIEDGNIYVNVHSTSYPDGLIRGQLEESDEDDDNDVDLPDNLADRIEALLERIEELTRMLGNWN